MEFSLKVLKKLLKNGCILTLFPRCGKVSQLAYVVIMFKDLYLHICYSLLGNPSCTHTQSQCPSQHTSDFFHKACYHRGHLKIRLNVQLLLLYKNHSKKPLMLDKRHEKLWKHRAHVILKCFNYFL